MVQQLIFILPGSVQWMVLPEHAYGWAFNIKIMQHNMCSFCKRDTETICHLFWHCSITQIFIKEILSHLRRTYNTIIHINQGNWFLLTDLTNIEVIIVTLMKSCIHKSRLKSAKPSVQVLLQNLKYEGIKEYNIAKANDKLIGFERKWGELRSLLN